MLRHFKMELRRQQELEQQQQQQQQCQIPCAPLAPVVMHDTQRALDMKKRNNLNGGGNVKTPTTQTKRVRGRRSSKPQMEKRRRARINECLDILKSYVLNDTANLNRFGIDPAASENQDEDTIARQILKSSGLIHRHKGRKNPNKLEKADILELTVNYVRRLHEQRDELLITSTTTSSATSSPPIATTTSNFQQSHYQPAANNHLLLQQVVPAHLNQPLTLDLSPKGRALEYQQQDTPTLRAYQPPPNTPLTPPPSSASSVQSANSDANGYQNQVSQMILSRVLESYKLNNNADWTSSSC